MNFFKSYRQAKSFKKRYSKLVDLYNNFQDNVDWNCYFDLFVWIESMFRYLWNNYSAGLYRSVEIQTAKKNFEKARSIITDESIMDPSEADQFMIISVRTLLRTIDLIVYNKTTEKHFLEEEFVEGVNPSTIKEDSEFSYKWNKFIFKK